MEQHTDLIEILIERVTDYGQTIYEFAKLKAVDKTSEMLS
jgi:hypothetical protein